MDAPQHTEELTPTFVERPLVNAILEHRDEWPYIYLEMAKVSKEDLLLDAEYCARYKHPSLTNFFKECGKIGGMHISMLRKIQRAGSYYESAQQRHSQLPQIINPQVCVLSPDTLIIVSKIICFLDYDLDLFDESELTLLSDLLCGHGLSRKELNYWLSYFEEANEYSCLDQAVRDFIKECRIKIDLSCATLENRGVAVEGSSNSIDDLLAIFANKGWLYKFLGATSRGNGVSVKILSAGVSSQQLGLPFSSCAFFETFGGLLRIHCAWRCGEKQLRQILESGTIPDIFTNSGIDCLWLVFDSRDEELANNLKVKKLGIGLLCCGEGVKALCMPVKLSYTSESRFALYDALLTVIANSRFRSSLPAFRNGVRGIFEI